MTVRLGLLSILAQGSCYGYQLRTELDRRTGSTGPINVGQIYNTLDRLERDKLVRKAGAQNYYEITDAGRMEVHDWFATATGSADLAEKIALASTLDGIDTSAIVTVQRAAANRRLTALDASVDSSTGHDTAAAIVAASGIESARAELKFLDVVERLIAEGVSPVPLSSDVPKRGRPAKTASV